MRKKFIFYIFFILMFILLVFLSSLSIKELERKIFSAQAMENTFEIDTSSPFSINKVVYFSSAFCNTEINSNSSFTIQDLYQYTDIAIFINNHSDDGNFTAENTLKSVSLSDVQFALTPSVGSPSIYFKNINDFTKNSFDENNKITTGLDFEVSSQDEIDLSKPILYNNCANPITLCYVNSGIKTDYTLTDSVSNLSYDGSLLKTCNITLNSISCKISFLITLINNLNEIYTCPMILTVPLSTENSTIYDGNLVLEDTTDYTFLKQ